MCNLYLRDPKTRDEFNAREKALKDRTSNLESAEAKGIAKGLEQGLEQGARNAKIQNAKNLLDILSDEMIAEKIGLTVNEVEELRK